MEIGAAPLEVVAFFFQLFDALVDRHNTAHLVADALRVLIGKEEIAVGHAMAADDSRYFPLRQRLAHLMSRNFRREADSSFRVGGRSSAALFVTGLAGQ